MTPMNLPTDLVEFLKAGRQLEYDPEACEAGAVTLLPLEQLRVERFPVDPSDREDDPHRGEGNYLVPAVNLLEPVDFLGTGFLLWLPGESRYGSWDEEHGHIYLLPQGTSWMAIANAPIPHLESPFLEPDAVPFETLTPYPRYPFSDAFFSSPRPDED